MTFKIGVWTTTRSVRRVESVFSRAGVQNVVLYERVLLVVRVGKWELVVRRA